MREQSCRRGCFRTRELDCRDAGAFLQRAIAGGLIVRDLRSNPALPRSLRVSVGTRAQNDALLASVEAA